MLQALNRHNFAYADRECDNKLVTTPGYLQWRDGGEDHMNDPMSIANLQVPVSDLLQISSIAPKSFYVGCQLIREKLTW